MCFWAAPPISRTLAAATLSLSILVYTHLLPGYYVVFWPQSILQFPPQLWRLLTSFLVTGPDLGILFDTYFLYTYGSKLENSFAEILSTRRFLYICIVCVYGDLGRHIFSLYLFFLHTPPLYCPFSAILSATTVPKTRKITPTS
ncbi:hypothetical protein EYC84_003706 [Monilinia fructicola]|uniref:Derlin n=1 Tax=Monilinia fructicola TaxID=38448 RepID=A0A5M9JX32_MONFR|nr:hypothetical protein EYC84_003706 [Monilinia fructicola]